MAKLFIKWEGDTEYRYAGKFVSEKAAEQHMAHLAVRHGVLAWYTEEVI